VDALITPTTSIADLKRNSHLFFFGLQRAVEALISRPVLLCSLDRGALFLVLSSVDLGELLHLLLLYLLIDLLH
jgi:hypothetical protein